MFDGMAYNMYLYSLYNKHLPVILIPVYQRKVPFLVSIDFDLYTLTVYLDVCLQPFDHRSCPGKRRRNLPMRGYERVRDSSQWIRQHHIWRFVHTNDININKSEHTRARTHSRAGARTRHTLTRKERETDRQTETERLTDIHRHTHARMNKRPHANHVYRGSSVQDMHDIYICEYCDSF